jgi:hypothetical protein
MGPFFSSAGRDWKSKRKQENKPFVESRRGEPLEKVAPPKDGI